MHSIDETFKRKVVAEYEQGGITKEELRLKYNIRGKSAVLKWCRLYGTKDYRSDPAPVNPPIAIETDLRQALADAQLRIAYLEAVIELASAQGLNVKKKFIGKRLKS